MQFIITDVQQTYDKLNRPDKSATQTGIQFGTPSCQLQRSYPNFVWSNIAPLLVTRSIENFWTARTNNGIRPPIHFYVLQFWASYDITWPKPFHYSCPNQNRNLWEIVAYIITWMTYIEMATSPQNSHSTALYTFQGIQWWKFQTSGWDENPTCSSH